MTKSLQSFREWAVAQGYNIGNPQTGTYKGECVSLVQQYLYQVFDIPYASRGHAKDFVPPTFNRVSGTPKPGDVLRYQYGKGGAGNKGHIGLVDDDKLFLNQNHNSDKKVYRDKIPAGYELFRPTKAFTVKKPAPAPTPATKPKVKVYGTKYINKDPYIGQVARFLFDNYPDYTPKAALGNYFGPNLTKAVKEFQRRTGLEADGNVGPITMAKLKSYGFKG